MSLTLRVVMAASLAAAGLLVVVSAFAPRRPSLATVTGHLARHTTQPRRSRRGAALLGQVRFGASDAADLRMVGRPSEQHAALLLVAAVAGLLVPTVVLTLLQAAGVVRLGVFVPLLLSLGAAVVAPLLVHTSMRADAAARRVDLRHQLSAYLDVVAMLLAANVGNEGALRQAAHTGDGRFFVELRRRMVVAETANRSLVHALGQLGDELELVELQQVAASAALGASSGAPVARTLSAKCESLRHALSAEQEAEARVRAGKITFPLVGMSLLIMTAVIYPALQFST
jgi:Flp pilus assembly protein TadB